VLTVAPPNTATRATGRWATERQATARPTWATATDRWTSATARSAMGMARSATATDRSASATARSPSVRAMVMWVRVRARSVMARVMCAWVMARVRRVVLVTAGLLMAVVRSVTVRLWPAVRALAMRDLPARWAVREAQALG